MRSEMFGNYLENQTQDRFSLQNPKMLRVAMNGDLMARQGSMVAYQGNIDFDYQGSGGLGKMLKKAVTGEGVPLMRAHGQGELFLADNASEVHLLYLENDAITVNGRNILAFDPSVSWDIRTIPGVGMMAGGLFNTYLQGTGWVAVTTHGTPVVLQTDAPTFADAHAAVAWSAHLQTSVRSTFKVGSLIGRGSGESFQLAFDGQGFVIVQASEGPKVPVQSH